MALGAVDAITYMSAAILAEIEEKKHSAAEKRVASYYLKEKYSDSESSSNREELQHVLSCLKYTVKDYKEEECDDDWRVLSICDVKIGAKDIRALVKRAVSNHYTAVEENADDANIYANCLHLFSKDYKCEIIENPGGALSWNYPVKIIIPMGPPEDPNRRNPSETSEDSNLRKSSEISKDPNLRKSSEISEDSNRSKSETSENSADSMDSWEPNVFRDGNFQDYKELLSQAAIARCRNRFPVPVILCGERYICRSGTLAVLKTVAYEVLTQKKEPESREVSEGALSQFWGGLKSVAERSKSYIVNLANALDLLINAGFMDDVKDLDVKVLDLLNIEFICDLMVENRKIHTGVSVGSSEKINIRKYGKFKILKIPYPGCTFFARYSDVGRNGENLVYEWDIPEINASIGMAADEEENLKPVDIDWQRYMTWDLLELTRNYMKLLLNYATDYRADGLLVHCISGWDRTPLFISLLRLSLWADDFIHTTLDAVEIAYLTLGYDWYLFGHDLPARLKKREEILHFCFNFLYELASPEYCMRKGTAKDRYHLMLRRDRLFDVRGLVLRFYEEKIKLQRTI